MLIFHFFNMRLMLFLSFSACMSIYGYISIPQSYYCGLYYTMVVYMLFLCISDDNENQRLHDNVSIMTKKGLICLYFIFFYRWIFCLYPWTCLHDKKKDFKCFYECDVSPPCGLLRMWRQEITQCLLFCLYV